jgi:hypothetical protein
VNNAPLTGVRYDADMLDCPPVVVPKWKRAMMNLFDAQGFTTAMTLAWNRPVGRARARKDLSALVARIDRAMLGARFNEKPKDERAHAVFVFEGFSFDHVHVHCAWRAPQNRWFEFGKLFGDGKCLRRRNHLTMPSPFIGKRIGIWNEIVPTGSIDIAPFNLIGSNDEITGYLLKSQHPSSDDRDIIWADEFHRLTP